MKKILLLFVLAALNGSHPLYGQLLPKTLFASGDWALRSDLDNNAIQEYGARAGILIDENLTLGGLASQEQFNRFNSSGPDITAQRYGLFTRYFFKGGARAAPFLEGEAFLGSRNFNFDVDELDFTRILGGFYLGGGLAWFLNPTAAVEGRAGLQRHYEEDLDPRTNLLADIGLSYFLSPGGESLGGATPPLVGGMLMAGGQASFRWRASGGETGSDPVIAVRPLIGYQLHPRWMAGGAFTFTSGQQVEGGGVILDEFDLSVGLHPFLRLYINPGDKFKVFAEGMAGAAFQRNRFNNEYPFRLRGSAGLDLFLSSNMALEAFLGYQTAKDLDADAGWEDGLAGGLGLRAFVGK